MHTQFYDLEIVKNTGILKLILVFETNFPFILFFGHYQVFEVQDVFCRRNHPLTFKAFCAIFIVFFNKISIRSRKDFCEQVLLFVIPFSDHLYIEHRHTSEHDFFHLKSTVLYDLRGNFIFNFFSHEFEQVPCPAFTAYGLFRQTLD